MKTNQKLFFLGLCFSSILLLSSNKLTPPTPSPIYIKNIIVHESIIYAEYDHPFYYLSIDEGNSWKQIDFENLPYLVQQQVGIYSELPLTLCLPAPSKVCYQTSNEKILVSSNGGKTWDISWNAPLGRKPLMDRIYPFNSFEVFDLAYLESDGNQIIVAAVGTEGVLIKTNDGKWQSVEVIPNTQTKQKVDGLENMIGYTSLEIATVNLSSFILLLLNSLINAKRKKSLSINLLLFTSFFPVSFALEAYWNTFFIGPIFVLIIIILRINPLLLWVLVPVLFGLYHVIVNANKDGKINFFLNLIVMAISLSLFPLWANGTIPVYETSLWIVIGLHTLLLSWILYFPIKKIMQARSSRSKRDLHE